MVVSEKVESVNGVAVAVNGGEDNRGFEDNYEDNEIKPSAPKDMDSEEAEDTRATWGNGIEFLMSCIATSVGLGNIWRFPFVAFQNGGGAFLIPYIIVLFLVGKPLYYMETILGQFSSRNSVRVWALAPAMKGIGWASVIGTSSVISYLVSIVALALYYLSMSFQTELPWTVCQPEWGATCFSASSNTSAYEIAGRVSSSEFYFLRVVLRQSDGIENGVGAPLWDLSLCLLASWFAVFLVIIRGVKSSGKAAYFLALFPYVIMIILFVRSVTLEGSSKGILFFITPQWDQLYDFDVWYAAVTQVFFSLSVCTGALLGFASYNNFKQNVYRDVMIITSLDTLTSLLSGLTIFGILGNLAHELGYEDVQDVVGSGGTGLAFISYPDAIAKFTFVPQLFAVLFFLMMFVLGVGTSAGLLTSINTALLDYFPRVGVSRMSMITCFSGLLLSLVYVTPGGQYILELVDYYGGTFLLLFVGIVETISVSWIYGLERLCVDIEFMTGRRTSAFWRWCWGVVMPAMMLIVFVYALFNFDSLRFGGVYLYPTLAYAAGYMLLFFGILQVPVWGIIALFQVRRGSFIQAAKEAFLPKEGWGPRQAVHREEWLVFSQQAAEERQRQRRQHCGLLHVWWILNGKYKYENGKPL